MTFLDQERTLMHAHAMLLLAQERNHFKLMWERAEQDKIALMQRIAQRDETIAKLKQGETG